MSQSPPAPVVLPPWPVIDFASFGPVKTRPLSRNQAITAAFMSRNWSMIPHVTHHDEVDVTDFEQRRRDWNAGPGAAKLTPMIPLIKAVATVLRRYPVFATSLDAAGKMLV